MKINIFSTLFVIVLFIVLIPNYGLSQTYQADSYNVKTGVGNGFKFWGSDYFKIDMGNSSLHKYGPVTDYSIKMNTSYITGRGWTWGVLNRTPIAALNNTGTFQIEGTMRSMSRTYYFGNTQNLYGDNSSALYWRGAHSTVTQLIMKDKENRTYGRLYGSGDGKNFGLLDGDGNWSYLAAKDNYTDLRINNSPKLRLSHTGLVSVMSARDASGTAFSGGLEIGGTLRLDGNEIITNTNTTLYLQHDNSGDVRMDNTTFHLDASEDKIGLGTLTPDYRLDVNGVVRAKEVRVETGWSDHVFLPEYRLPELSEEEAFITENGHLLGFESEKDMGGEVKLADVTNRQQEAIEKLMLHVIQLEKQIKVLEERLEEDKQ